nr:asparagine synthase-related protein [uncultured Draconibacterium sp.]
MGFICGIINFEKKTITSGEILSLANATGYPNFKFHTETDNNIALGYCHYPGRQPKGGIYSEDEILVVADIRIYNHEKLRQFFDFNSPEEAFAKAYLKWGTSCAGHINGDFAAVVIDKKKEEVVLFRDHIGTRPLVYWRSGNLLVFASHEFGLAKSGLIPIALSEKKLIDRYFRFNKLYSLTSFENILKVVPGHFVTHRFNGQCTSSPYWNPEKIQKDTTLTFEKTVLRLRELLVTATVNRMESGKTGMHVSGGIDSCGVAAIVADHTSDKKSLTGYSWTPETFENPVEGVNEKEFIDVFEKDKNIRVKYLDLEKNETVKNSIIPEFETQHIEHPVMQMAEKDDIETLFSGWGGDEFVSLSQRGSVNHLFFSLKWRTLLKYTGTMGIKATVMKLRTEVLPLFIPFGLLGTYKVGKTDLSKLRLFRFSFIKKHWKQIFLHHRKNIFGYGNRTQFTLNLLENRHLPERMDSWAINAEKYGFDYKYPLLDKDVLDFWFSIPVEYTYKNFHSRLLYREAMKGILTEKIRIRKDKAEALRIACTLSGIKKGKDYLEKLFNFLEPEEQLPFFRPEAFVKVFDRPFSDEFLSRSLRDQKKYTLYLQYVMLVKKYLR